MARCTHTTNLHVHQIKPDGGNGLNNAIVLCSACHSEASTFGMAGKSPESFSDAIKAQAFQRAGNQCQCDMAGCEHKM